VAAGVKIATGADLNPIGPRLHAELGLLEEIGIPRLAVLHAATASGRELNGLGKETSPQPGSAADLIVLEGNPLDDISHLRRPRGVIVYGRMVVDPRHGGLAAPTPGPYS
jgi:imidazolonepropionase-like amidohydrolase